MRLSILLGLLCLSWSARAHQPDLSSTILAEKEENEWVLQVRAALTAFEYEVEARFGASAYATPKEFQQLVVEHLRDELFVRFNDGTAAVLKNGVVKLGHETTVTFQLSSPPADVQSVVVRNTSFSNISHNQSALFIAREGFDKKQFMLNGSNSHTAKLRVSDAKFVVVPPSEGLMNILPMLVLWGASLVMVLLYLVFSRRQVSSPIGIHR